MGESAITIGTPVGPARALPNTAPDPIATVVLGHGAGGGLQAPDLVVVARELPRRRISVVLVEQPWRVAGRKVSAPPATLDRAWLAVLEELRIGTRLVVGGRSAGARVACRTALATGARGVVALAFPLHPPGRPQQSRVAELTGAGVPVLVVQGTRDLFGGPSEFPPGTELRPVDDADHGFKVPKSSGISQSAMLASVAADVAGWVERLAVAS
ncbi:MAG TPA: alpha/beta family hydrolase [Actinomycetes bacterium]|nr:alpha/beta family hydrolase [Actinomycetes bacterium]